jgi:Skp family chaperone for outer membrane proteins
MTKKVVLFAVLILSLNITAQKAQRFGYIDMEYILENIPEYNEAQSTINTKALSWQKNIEEKQQEIEDLKASLRNEKVLLTPDLIEERSEDIEIKELDLKKLQASYFGPDGDLFFLRKQLVNPIQDLVFNAVQDIATKRGYDFVFDNSADLIMLYSNKQFDISDLVISSITRIKKIDEVNSRKSAKEEKQEITDEPIRTEEAQEKIDEKELKRAELKKSLDEKRAEQLKKREELLKANAEKRQQRIDEIEAAKKAKEISIEKAQQAKEEEKQ